MSVIGKALRVVERNKKKMPIVLLCCCHDVLVNNKVPKTYKYFFKVKTLLC